jgi:hypothetical protein
MNNDAGDMKTITYCRTALIFQENEQFAVTDADAERCFLARHERSIYTQFSGVYAWAAKICAHRLHGRLAEANRLLDLGIAEYEAMLADKTLDPLGHQAVSAASIMQVEAWALGRWDWIRPFCAARPNHCSDTIKQVMLAQSDPKALTPMELPLPENALSAPELLTMLYLEQQRVGHCPIERVALEQYISHFRQLGSKVSLRTLENMRVDCQKNQPSVALNQFYKYITN